MMYNKIFFIFIISLASGQRAFSSPCAQRFFGPQHIVCVCNETYCDELNLLTSIPKGQAALYESNINGKRFETTLVNFTEKAQPAVPTLLVNKSQMFQFILGFGGAFTDAAGINVNLLKPQLQSKILSSYFSTKGLQYNMGRVPMASTDFSTRTYSYADDAGDFDLSNFTLAEEDLTKKIPLIKAAESIAQDELLLFSSPWSAPWWMKTNLAMQGQGALKGKPGGKYYKTWAKYFVKFLQTYQQHNISFWGTTMQNEPTDGCLKDFRFQAMCFPPEQQRDFLKSDLGPALAGAGFGPDELRIMLLDDMRSMLPRWVDVIMKDQDASQYASGVAFHWYGENLLPHKLLDITHSRHPNLFFLATEACTGYYPWEFPKVNLGDWGRAERYAHDILQDLLNWSIGWIDWNLVLNEQGGPNWANNYVDAPVIIKADLSEFYKQPMYYAIAHFSKCLTRGSYRITLEPVDSLPTSLEVGAFRTPQDNTVVIVLNRAEKNENLNLFDEKKGYLNIKVLAHSMQTYVW